MNSRGKKVLDIEWKKDGVTFKVPVKAYQKTDFSDDKGDGQKMVFRAELKDAGIDVQGTDINQLRREVIEKLDEWYTTKWELYVLVKIDGGNYGYHGNNIKHTVDFESEFYAIGKDSRGKTVHMRVPKPDKIEAFDASNPTRWGGEQPREGMPEVGERIKSDGYSGSRHPRTRALVKATLENVAAIEQFTKAMDGLLQKMHHHFAPDRIEQLLRNVGMLLPAPKAEK